METERQDGWYWVLWGSTWMIKRSRNGVFRFDSGDVMKVDQIGERIPDNETLRQMREKAEALDWLEDSGEGLVSDFAATVGEQMIWKVEARSNWHDSPLAAIRAAREQQ